MTDPAPRRAATRKADVLARLTTDIDAWVSTASPDGTPCLVPLSFLWTGETLIVSTASRNPTSLNLQTNPQVHLAIGHTRDVVLITGTAAPFTPTSTQAEAFATKTGFDPSSLKASYPYFGITPTRIQAWREANELAGRDLMTEGTWLI
ncbi:pyridoxamine 5'-phosphate oxidase-related FMN- binding protein [Kribbella flavida DSM 17836]|uniref:Pyridoxamine 5'-phosphate oxidase-related FMN-binding protein n=1 Tax=Kribbella flavida (strain DSM 17836 / JCM 10339 / NBRC 14399) TaxID=479435 RepID=D2PKS9_KRIFD|nr:pyridoxamine 5'-phosphate oxidase family protein [Kribbella flavida]ADB32396.1 pyridoxamine 5'-phosphate oxidase-related FMN- binding protein [Kribbella flavida DSM 17836]